MCLLQSLVLSCTHKSECRHNGALCYSRGRGLDLVASRILPELGSGEAMRVSGDRVVPHVIWGAVQALS